MKKELKDYLHLYLGCEILVQGIDLTEKNFLTGVTNGGYDCEYQMVDDAGKGNASEEPSYASVADVKPVLRPLSSMTEQERREALITVENGNTITTHYEGMRYLLSKSFDLFGLIEAGLAIDSTQINQP